MLNMVINTPVAFGCFNWALPNYTLGLKGEKSVADKQSKVRHICWKIAIIDY